MIHLIVDWATQRVPFPRFNLHLKEGQSLESFIVEVEKKVDTMIGESTLNEYKAFKALVKHKRSVNHVFSECGTETALCSRPPGTNKKLPVVVVATCSAPLPKAPRWQSSRRGMERMKLATLLRRELNP
jgi:hypothetical protein